MPKKSRRVLRSEDKELKKAEEEGQQSENEELCWSNMLLGSMRIIRCAICGKDNFNGANQAKKHLARHFNNKTNGRSRKLKIKQH